MAMPAPIRKPSFSRRVGTPSTASGMPACRGFAQRVRAELLRQRDERAVGVRRHRRARGALRAADVRVLEVLAEELLLRRRRDRPVRVVAVAQRRGERERVERRAERVLAARVVADALVTAVVGAHGPASRVDRDDGPAELFRLALQPLPQGFLRGVLPAAVQRRLDGHVPVLEPAEREAVPFQLGEDLLLDVELVVGDAAGAGLRRRLDLVAGVGHRFVVLDVPTAHELVAHVLPPPGGVEVARGGGVVDRRRLDHPGEEGGFAPGDRVVELLAEVGVHRRRGAERAAAEGDDVDVAFEDLFLALFLGDLRGQHELGELAPERRVVVAGGLLDVLLGDPGPAADAGEERTADAGRVEALVVPEGRVLGGDDGVAQLRGHPRVGDETPVAVGRDHLEQLGPVRVLQDDGLAEAGQHVLGAADLEHEVGDPEGDQRAADEDAEGPVGDPPDAAPPRGAGLGLFRGFLGLLGRQGHERMTTGRVRRFCGSLFDSDED